MRFQLRANLWVCLACGPLFAQSPHVTVVDVQSVSAIDPCLNRQTNIADVFILIQAFQGNNYPFTVNPASCQACP